MSIEADNSVRRIVVVMPNWLGDAVMATPFLRALRGRYPGAHIAALALPLAKAVVEGLAGVDEVREYKKGEEGAAVRWMRGGADGKFDLAVILPNSFRSAWMVWRAGVKRRVGYGRDWRGWMLTEGLKPEYRTFEDHRRQVARGLARGKKDHSIRWGTETRPKRITPAANKRWIYEYEFSTRDGVFSNTTDGVSCMMWRTFDLASWFPRLRGYRPVPTIDYYLALMHTLGGKVGQPPTSDERRMELGITVAERAEAEGALREAGVAEGEALVVLVPGANFGASKCWMPERFAAVARQLAEVGGEFGAKVLIAAAPAEMPVVEEILRHVGANLQVGARSEFGMPLQKDAKAWHPERIIALGKLNGGRGIGLGALKEIVRRSRLMVCNDTGPRHFAVALGVPVVTLFGPTDPVWAETFYERERQVRLDPFPPCGPCQLKTCPIDHRCMRGIEVEMVMGAVRELWSGKRPEQGPGVKAGTA